MTSCIGRARRLDLLYATITSRRCPQAAPPPQSALCALEGHTGILVLKAKRDITLEDLQKGPVFLSFAYRGTFFRPAIPGELTPKGYRQVCCGCRNNSVYPRNMVRFERAVVGGVPVTQLARPLVPAAEHQSQVISVLIDSGPTKDTDENTEIRLWKKAEADLRRLDPADARLSTALDIVRAKRGAASNCLERIGVLQHSKVSDADGNCALSFTPRYFRLSRMKMSRSSN